jgi:hypothetical protein
MRSMILLAGFAVLAWSLPAEAQPRQRDHRAADDGVSVQGFEPERGEPGTQVTIRGRNFPDSVQVMIGGQRVQPDRVTGRSITFTVPELRPGNQSITLQQRGRELAPVGNFGVRPVEAVPARRGASAEPPPRTRDHRRARKPVVSGYTPSRGPAGTEVTIRGRNFDDATRVYVDGRRVRNATVSNQSITFQIPQRSEGSVAIALREGDSRDDLLVGSFDVRERRADRRAERDKRQAEREQQARERWEQRRRGLPETAEERRRRLQEEQEKLERTREERRRAEAARLRAQWERQFLSHPQVRAELSLHAERLARLRQMLRLAEIDAHDNLVIRIEVLMDRESRRHERRMAMLRAQLQ